MNIELERYKRLPMNAGEVWQGALVEMPVWVGTEDPVRPEVVIWVSSRTGHAGKPVMREPGQSAADVAVRALIEVSREPLKGSRPGVLEVRGAELASGLRETLAGSGTRIVEVPSIPLFDEMFESFSEHMSPVPGPLDGEGVTVEAMRGFAEAAKLFHRAAPWMHLVNDDLIEIESPKAPPEMRFATVLGNGGEEYGLGFYGSPEDCWDIRRGRGDSQGWMESRKGGVCSLMFKSRTETPMRDVDLWEAHGLPLAGKDAYPLLMHYGTDGEPSRVDAVTLGIVEGLLRALAATTESQMDSGRWEQEVVASGKSTLYRLALPDLLNPPGYPELIRRGFPPNMRMAERFNAMAARFLQERGVTDMEEANKLIKQEFIGKVPDPSKYPGRNAQEKAQDLCYDALDAIGRRVLLLLRKAVETDPDCAEAYTMLAQRQSDPARAVRLLRRAVEAAERGMGPDPFTEFAGEFWSMHETRPYLRAVEGLAHALVDGDRLEEAVEQFQQMIRVNPGDNQGARHALLPLLMELKRDAEAVELLNNYSEDGWAIWSYARAILAFRASGGSPEADRHRRVAVQRNRHVLELLAMPDPPMYGGQAYTLGSVEEALMSLEHLVPVIGGDAALLEWLLAEPELMPKRRPRPASKKKRKGKSR